MLLLTRPPSLPPTSPVPVPGSSPVPRHTPSGRPLQPPLEPATQFPLSAVVGSKETICVHVAFSMSHLSQIELKRHSFSENPALFLSHLSETLHLFTNLDLTSEEDKIILANHFISQ